MLSKQDNETLCQVGPGTLMGNLMRLYWIPAVRSDELATPDCPPLRIRLLGENLIAFRQTSGKVGLIQNACPHRGASMFFGRNEVEGLRCVYHGWKFDAEGSCVDMPSEPAESNFKNKVHATAYPTRERNGIIWAYMGPRPLDNLPPLPHLEANMIGGNYSISIIHRPCNWMQGWEGEMDTVHQAFLHYGAMKVEDTTPGTFDHYIAKYRAPKFSVLEIDGGTSYGAYRPAEDDTYYWRIAHQLFPFYAMIPTGEIGRSVRFGAYVPMDDYHTLHWEIGISIPGETGSTAGNNAGRGQGGGRPRDLFKPNTTDWYGRFNMEQNAANDYLIDREAQKNWQSYTGIEGIRQQDMAVTESMGAIMDRTREHLGTTDQLIIRTRRKLIATAKALVEEGITPPGVDNPEFYQQRSGGVILPRSVDWWEGTAEQRARFYPGSEAARQTALSQAP